MQTSLSLTFDRIEHSVCQSAWKSVKDVHQFLCFVYKRGARKHKSLCRPPPCVCEMCVCACEREDEYRRVLCTDVHSLSNRRKLISMFLSTEGRLNLKVWFELFYILTE